MIEISRFFVHAEISIGREEFKNIIQHQNSVEFVSKNNIR